MKQLRQIRLIEKDFNTLNIMSRIFSHQYTHNYDCPIARALRRKGFTRVEVTSYSFKTKETGLVNSDNIEGYHLRRAAISLSKGRKYAIIKI